MLYEHKKTGTKFYHGTKSDFNIIDKPLHLTESREYATLYAILGGYNADYRRPFFNDSLLHIYEIVENTWFPFIPITDKEVEDEDYELYRERAQTAVQQKGYTGYIADLDYNNELVILDSKLLRKVDVKKIPVFEETKHIVRIIFENENIDVITKMYQVMWFIVNKTRFRFIQK